ncbi:MAG: nickel-type superoxide dismutase maturation protease [Ardenticatenaceae bacterium]
MNSDDKTEAVSEGLAPDSGAEERKDDLPDLTLREFLLWLFRFRQRFRVTNNSMLPLLKPGDEMLVDPRAYRGKSPTPGDIVIAQHPNQTDLQIVKRVASVGEDGRCVLIGDNRRFSSDSRSFGAVDCDLILGRVSCRFA